MKPSTASAVLLLLATCLGACDPATQQGPSLTATAVVPRVTRTAPAPLPAASLADDAATIALASDLAARAAREQTLRVQRQLVEQRRAARDAAQQGDGNERCIGTQRMRRVANGWVQAGAC